MNTNGYVIRLEKKNEQREVENLVRESFWNIYRPGCYEHYLLHVMRDDADFVPELNYVIELDGKVIGQTVFVNSKIVTDSGTHLPTLSLGPICIAPEFKRQGYGKALLDYAFEKAAEYGYGAVLFEGNIDFYGKCGCETASNYHIRYHGLGEGEDASFFLCRILKDGYLDGTSGVYKTPDVYFVSESDVDEFDKGFPPKQKLKLPGQLF
jgi:predicted N-acetyltransferase YhbS